MNGKHCSWSKYFRLTRYWGHFLNYIFSKLKKTSVEKGGSGDARGDGGGHSDIDVNNNNDDDDDDDNDDIYDDYVDDDDYDADDDDYDDDDDDDENDDDNDDDSSESRWWWWNMTKSTSTIGSDVLLNEQWLNRVHVLFRVKYSSLIVQTTSFN